MKTTTLKYCCLVIPDYLNQQHLNCILINVYHEVSQLRLVYIITEFLEYNISYVKLYRVTARVQVPIYYLTCSRLGANNIAWAHRGHHYYDRCYALVLLGSVSKESKVITMPVFNILVFLSPLGIVFLLL